MTGLNNYLATIKDSQVEKKDDISSSNNNNSNRRSLGKDPRSKVNSTAEPKPPGQDTARRNALEALRGIHEAVEGRGHSDSLGQLKGLLTPEQGEAAGGGGVVGAADNLKEELLSAQQLIAFLGIGSLSLLLQVLWGNYRQTNTRCAVILAAGGHDCWVEKKAQRVGSFFSSTTL